MKKQFKPLPNSFKNTFCVFKEVGFEAVSDLAVQYESKAGSVYYYTKEGMFRVSNHWGKLANSRWRLEPMETVTSSKLKLGFAHWKAFYPDNPTDKLYYLEVDFDIKKVSYQHKDNPNFDKKAVLRTSGETTKKIKQIRNLLELSSWAKHFDYQNLDELRIKIIDKLIYTEQNLDEIKRLFL